MSGIFISEMIIPEHCGVCPLSILNSYGERECFVTECKVTNEATYLTERHERCPMEEID